MEDVVAKNHADTIVANELLTDDECLGQTVGGRLLSILQSDTEVGTVAQQALEAGKVVRGGYHQYILDTCKHQYRQRVVDHGLVEDWNQLFRDALRDGVEAGATATG